MSDDLPASQEAFDAMLSWPNLHDDRPEMIEVVTRGVRRLAYVVDPGVTLEPTEPFDLAQEIEALRAVALKLTPDLATGKHSLLTFLHREPAGDGFPTGLRSARPPVHFPPVLKFRMSACRP